MMMMVVVVVVVVMVMVTVTMRMMMFNVCDRAGRDTRRPKVLYQPSSTRYHRQSSTEVSAMCYHC